ncbi:acyl carrier protein [Mycoplasma nasistruthionis]|nr:phosphopantetheine-binding protein [Mycoplasma nasistruthionis]
MEERKLIIINELKRLSKKTNISEDDIIRDLGVDSLDLAELLFEAEERFGVSISDDQLRDVKTVKDIISMFTN